MTEPTKPNWWLLTRAAMLFGFCYGFMTIGLWMLIQSVAPVINRYEHVLKALPEMTMGAVFIGAVLWIFGQLFG